MDSSRSARSLTPETGRPASTRQPATPVKSSDAVQRTELFGRAPVALSRKRGVSTGRKPPRDSSAAQSAERRASALLTLGRRNAGVSDEASSLPLRNATSRASAPEL